MRWVTLVNMLGEARRRADERKQAARADFGKWLAAAKPDALAGQVPAEGLAFQAGLSEGAGNKVECSVAGKPRAIELPGAVTWGKGQVAEKAYTVRAGQTTAGVAMKDELLDPKGPFNGEGWGHSHELVWKRSAIVLSRPRPAEVAPPDRRWLRFAFSATGHGPRRGSLVLMGSRCWSPFLRAWSAAVRSAVPMPVAWACASSDV